MLPWPSCLSVSNCPEIRLRHRCSSRSLHISPLHREFHLPLRDSREAVSGAVPQLGRGISHPTYLPAYAPFTPSDSEQRLPPPYYRGCWHVVSRGFLGGYRPFSSPPTVVYIPRDFIPHAASLRQAFAHCGRFLTAASRRSWGRVSVPMWLVVLSDQLPVNASVGRHPTD